jgi:quercetin dioxygenase-like cupin family protein
VKTAKLSLALTLAAAVVAATWGIQSAKAQAPGFTRVELQRRDTSIQGREAVTARAEFIPGGAVGKHTHPGEEIGYVLEGSLQLEVAGAEPVVLKAGDTFFVPAGTVHAGKNVGTGPAKILSTYVVEKGKPLATLVK